MRQAQQRPAVPLEKIDLDEARARRDLIAPIPTEAVGEAMDRHDLLEGAARRARRVAADPFDEIKSARVRLGLASAPIQLKIFSGSVR